eukprot:c18361_g1_i2.p2 GENE.c18361_g1_i2~~c18361_g1_i2.p2  ORF type:complete len:190 (-),score=46.40 c18361_g1_i2:494-1063(-)
MHSWLASSDKEENSYGCDLVVALARDNENIVLENLSRVFPRLLAFCDNHLQIAKTVHTLQELTDILQTKLDPHLHDAVQIAVRSYAADSRSLSKINDNLVKSLAVHTTPTLFLSELLAHAEVEDPKCRLGFVRCLHTFFASLTNSGRKSLEQFKTDIDLLMAQLSDDQSQAVRNAILDAHSEILKAFDI